MSKEKKLNLANDCTGIVFCGGKATRLKTVLSGKPKALVNIDRNPYLYGLLRQFGNFGIKKIVLCISSITEEISQVFGDGSNLGFEIKYSYDSGLHENANALYEALPHINTPMIVCINGDTIVDLNFGNLLQVHNRQDTVGTIVVSSRTDQPHPQAIEVTKEGKVADLHEWAQDLGRNINLGKYCKGYANSGIYVFNVDPLRRHWLIQEQTGKLEEGLLRTLAKKGELSAYDNGDRYLIDIGTPERLKEAQLSLSSISKFFEV